MPDPQLDTDLTSIKERMSDVDTKARQLTPLEIECLDLICEIIGNGQVDCCRANAIAEKKGDALVRRYRSGVDYEDYVN
jgi:hypothetical protein